MPHDLDMNALLPPLLNHQQFTAADVLSVTGLSAGQLKGILDRNQITLSVNHNPGTGRRRMFNGQDLIALSAVQSASRVGFPLRWGNVLAQQVIAFARRVHFEGQAEVKTPHMALAFYPADEGEDWAFVPILDGREASQLPTAFQVLNVTEEIEQTLAKLRAITEDQPMPEFRLEQPKPFENVYAPRSNFMKLWEEDESGAWRYVGLTLEETKILMADEGIALDGDDLTYLTGIRNEDRHLIAELTERREIARLKKCGIGDDD